MTIENLILQILFFLVKVNILKTEQFRLDINPIAPIYWLDNNTIMVNEENQAFTYNILNREKVQKFKREQNQIYGGISGNIFSCEWYNRDIDSPEEFSTHLIQKSKSGKEVLDIELKPTTEVIECKDEIILKTVPPIEEKYFEFSDDLYEVDDITKDILSPNYKRYITRDSLGNYWITEFKLFIKL